MLTLYNKKARERKKKKTKKIEQTGRADKLHAQNEKQSHKRKISDKTIFIVSWRRMMITYVIWW